MGEGGGIRRREFLRGGFGGRAAGPAAKAGLELPEISRDYVAPLHARDIPEWDPSLESVLEQLDDLSGIEEP